MTAIPEPVCLYTRGAESVRLVREVSSTDCRLFVHGPGTSVVAHEFADVAACMKAQAVIEQHLVTAGYQLARPTTERRGAAGTWGGPAHRRTPAAASD
jgi:hypothetical protein